MLTHKHKYMHTYINTNKHTYIHIAIMPITHTYKHTHANISNIDCLTFMHTYIHTTIHTYHTYTCTPIINAPPITIRISLFLPNQQRRSIFDRAKTPCLFFIVPGNPRVYRVTLCANYKLNNFHMSNYLTRLTLYILTLCDTKIYYAQRTNVITYSPANDSGLNVCPPYPPPQTYTGPYP